ncbi:hypothetical protein BHU72_11820 [Desulfuribacillus stibiiarsenatis]|uniref:Uncharacterized protein n=1 Tax=Desulfuribacillus stibiiarsenatis TaxID=1390249 RepID=A0A1E5L7W0_9FIRM|nr:hypothetical protein [Desulfuribacillus stibiiarsenatis]OEH86216.1 hypothetical protein BHU72_11820 [Desulfuribacillus stibiiarsenatis]
MSNVDLKTFPYGKTTALTMLYLEKQDLSNLSPEELVDKYNEVYEKISKRFSEPKSNKTITVRAF